MTAEHYRPMIQAMQHLTQQVDPTADFAHRYMFGGVGLYTRGQIFGILMFTALEPTAEPVVWILLKLPPDAHTALHTGEPVPESPISKAYAVIPPSIAEDEAALMGWLERSLRHVWSLKPGKKRS
ncbi:MAG: hypothetical protein SF162_20165 [bacterium]|nr:hypothetical protein [bacterium]